MPWKAHVHEALGLVMMAGEMTTGRITALMAIISLIGMFGSAIGSGAVIYFGLKQDVQQNSAAIQFNDYKINHERTARQQNFKQIMNQLDRIERDYYGPKFRSGKSQ